MNSRELVQKSLNHQQTDKIPVDFGSTAVTGIHVLAVEKLRAHYGLEKRPVKLIEPYQMLGEVDNELKDIIGVDTVGVTPRNTMFGFANENYREFKTWWGQEILVPEKFNTTVDSDGSLLIYPEGDTSVVPSGKMPANGYFFDAIIRQEHFDESNLDVSDNIEEFGRISDQDLQYWKDEIRTAAETGRAVVATFGGTAFGDIALVPGLNLKDPRGIRDIAEWYMSTVLRQDYIHQIFEKQAEVALENLAKIYSVAGNAVDAVFICGTDFGTQDSQFCSGDTFDSLYKPYYQKINGWIHKNTTWKTFKHSCGAVEPLLENIIESGFDIINPLQISAAGMAPKAIKEKYGEKLVFWGGGVDTQKVLSFGTPEEVSSHVLNNCETFSKHSGFVFNTVHNIQANVPLENLVAMIDAVKKFNSSS
jgi:hypothetical protein